MGLQFWIQILPFVVLIILGFSIGGFVERAHSRQLKVREEAVRDVMVTDLRTFPVGCETASIGLVTGEVVIASDYFKTFAAGLRKMIGGDLRTYETLMERARREALVRMMESAKAMGANHVANVRLASSNIGSGGAGGRRSHRAAMVEVYAYGTAVFVPSTNRASS